jgi:hypothetical protein
MDLLQKQLPSLMSSQADISSLFTDYYPSDSTFYVRPLRASERNLPGWETGYVLYAAEGRCYGFFDSLGDIMETLGGPDEEIKGHISPILVWAH